MMLLEHGLDRVVDFPYIPLGFLDRCGSVPFSFPP